MYTWFMNDPSSHQREARAQQFKDPQLFTVDSTGDWKTLNFSRETEIWVCFSSCETSLFETWVDSFVLLVSKDVAQMIWFKPIQVDLINLS